MQERKGTGGDKEEGSIVGAPQFTFEVNSGYFIPLCTPKTPCGHAMGPTFLTHKTKCLGFLSVRGPALPGLLRCVRTERTQCGSMA